MPTVSVRKDATTTWWRTRTIPVVIAAMLATVFGVVGPQTTADAVVVDGMMPNFSAVVNGDFITTGNGVLTCSGQANCANLMSAASTRYNDNFNMIANDQDGNSATYNSSAAQVTIPNGATVVKAQLEWMANTGSWTADGINWNSGATSFSCNVGQTGGAATLATGQPNSPLNQPVLLNVAGAGYTSVSYERFAAESPPQLGANQSQYYSAQADVTSAFASIPTGTPQTIWVGNVWAPQGLNCAGGWVLNLVFDFGTALSSNTASYARQVTLYDGHVRTFTGDTTSLTLSGFTAVATGARLSVGLLEGDTYISGDTGTYTTNLSSTLRSIPGATGVTSTSTGNLGVSFADGAQALLGGTAGQSSNGASGSLPGSTSTLNRAVTGSYNASIDAHAVALSNVTAGVTQLNISINSNQDSYLWKSAAVSVPVAQLRVVKTATNDADTQTINQGATPSFKIVVTNTGSSTINTITVSDAQATACAVPTGFSLAPGVNRTITCNGPIATDSYVNVATATGTDAAVNQAVNDQDGTQVNVLKPQVDATKSGGTITGPDASGNYTVTYNVSVANTGQGNAFVGPLVDTPAFSSNLTVSGTSWQGTSGGATSGSVTGAGPGTLAPAGTQLQGTVAGGGTGQTMTWTVTSTFRFNDQNAATTCSGTGTGLYNGLRLDGATESTTTNNSACVNPPVRTPLIDASKTPGTVTGPDANGDYIVTYTMNVKNSGQVDGTYGPLTDTPSFAPNLAVTSASWSASGPGAPSPNSGTGAGPFTLAGPGTVLTAGSTHSYSMAIKFHFTNNTAALPCNLAAPGTGLYNKAGVSGDTTASNDVACVQPPQPPVASVTLDKQASAITDVNTNGISDAGDQITYSFLVRNTSQVNLTDIRITDAKLGLSNVLCFAGTVAPGATVTCSPVVYTLLQADVTAGNVQNTATASGLPPTGTQRATGSDSTYTSVIAGPSIAFNKSVGSIVDANNNGRVDAGDTVVYTFRATNTGNLNLTNVVVNDTQIGVTNLSCGNIAVGASATCTPVTYALTQAEVNAGAIDNTAIVQARASDNSTVTANGSAHLTIPAAPSIVLDKQAGAITDVNGNGRTDVGDTIAFTYTVTNNGTVSLNPVRLYDPNLGVSNSTCGAGALAPGATTTCPAATHSITQTDLDSGTYNNTATVSGVSPSGSTVQFTDNTSSDVVGTARLVLRKTAGSVVDANNNGKVDVGDTITYSFLVTNDGSVSLTNLTVTDSVLGLNSASICGSGALGAGTSRACSTASYTLTQADLDSGSVNNTASAFGRPPVGNPVSSSDSTSVTVGAASSIALTKTASAIQDTNGNGRIDPGDTINYTFAVQNTGSVTLNNVEIVDTKISSGAIACGSGPLAAGASRDCVTSIAYRLTQADIDAGAVNNTARARALNPSSQLVEGPATRSVPVTQAPSIALDKQVVASGDAGTTPVADVNRNGRVDVGDTLTYSFSVTNTGNVTLNPVQLVDTKLGQNYTTCLSAPLAPGATANCPNYTYTLTQADVNSGTLDNSAAIHGKSPLNVDVTGTDTTSTKVLPIISLSLAKTAGTITDVNGNGVNDAGDTITYNFRVVNTGTISLNSVLLTDTKLSLSDRACLTPQSPLDPGLSRDCTPVTYTLTRADVNSGNVHNDATAVGVGSDPNATRSLPAPSMVDVPIVSKPSLSLDKSVAPAGVVDANSNGKVDAGDTITYNFAITNTGNVSLSTLRLTDGKLGLAGTTCDAADTTPLAPGATRTCTSRTYTLTTTDLDSGSVANSATATGTSPDAKTWTGGDSTSTALTSAPGITLDKQRSVIADLDGNGPDAGDTFTYTFVVRNTGTVTLNPVTVTDAKLGLNAVDCGVGPVPAGATRTCAISRTYTVTQADANAGLVVNNATAVGTPPTGSPVSGSDTETADFSLIGGVQPPSVAVDKQAAAPVDTNANGKIDAGDSITFTFVITNTGTVTLFNPTVTDAQLGLSATPCISATALDPGVSRTCRQATKVLTQADINAGTYDNTATASAVGPPPTNAAVTSQPDATSTPITQANAFTFVKSVAAIADTNGDGRNSAGDKAAYRFFVTNTGNTTLSSITVTDSKLGLSAVTCGTGTLQPGQSTYCFASGWDYTLTQADLNTGSVTNTAVLTATPPVGAPITQTNSVTRTLTTSAGLTLDKVAGVLVDVDNSGTASLGDTIAYTFTVANTGTVSLNPVTVSDSKLGMADVECGTGPLLPGATNARTCTAPAYTLTQADLDAGTVNNSATATGTTPQNTTTTSGDATSVSLSTVPQLVLTKTAGSVVDSNNNGRQDAGDTVQYTFSVRNAGNVTLNTVTLTDSKLGLSNVACGTGPLAPQASRSCGSPIIYTLTAADLNAGNVINNATISAITPSGTQVTGPGTTNTTLTETPSVTLDKAAQTIVDTNGDGRVTVGDTVTYTFVAQNTGTVALSGVTLVDSTLGLNVACGSTPLAAGTSRTCTPVTHALTQAEIDAGAINNTATISGTSPKGTVASGTDSTSVTISQTPGLSLTKTASALADNGDGRQGPGDTITYTFSVTNTGTVTLNPVVINDSKIGLVNEPCGTGPLAAGATRACLISKAYTVTVADANVGAVNNTAVATGTRPDGNPQTGSSSTTTTIATSPAFTFDKAASSVLDTNGDGRTPTVGDTITYTFTVQNTGNVSLSAPIISDTRIGVTNLACGSAPLDPGQPARVCPTVTYTLTQADLDAGAINNTATLTVVPPSGQALTTTDQVSTSTSGTPVISVDKTSGGIVDANADGQLNAGDTITYAFSVTNGGTQTLDPVTITDAKLNITNLACFAGPLAPGQTRTCSVGSQATYTLTAADADAGRVTNIATVSGKPPTGNPVTATDDVTDTIVATPSLAVDKSAGQLMDLDGNGPDVGDTINFSFVVTNTGNVSLSNVVINDAKAGLSNAACGITPLAPGASRTCSTVTYTLTQADVDAGSVANSATATGRTPTNATVTSNTDTTSSSTVGRAVLTLDKTAGAINAGADGIINAGDSILYSFSVRNAGTYTLTNVRYSDSTLGFSNQLCVASLAPGATATCPAVSHALAQAEIDAGTVENNASATATDPAGGTSNASDTTSTTVAQSSTLTIDKATTGVVTDANGDGRTPTAGDTVTYTFSVVNTGTTTLTNVTYTDLKLGVNGLVCGSGTVAPGATLVCAARTYTLTQADVDAGKVDNAASASGRDPKGATITGNDTATVTLTQSTGIVLTKAASSVVDNGDGVTPNVGDQITYTFTVRNTGNTTLTLVRLTDAKLGLSAVNCDSTTLAAGATATCRTANYTLTQADINAGQVVNNASITATPPFGPNVNSSTSNTANTAGTSSYVFDKSAGSITDVDRNGLVNAGDTIAYSFTVTNTGTTSLTNVTYTDNRIGLGTTACGSGPLEPGVTRQCATRVYTLTQSDIDTGSVVNSATSTATTPTGAILNQSDSASVASSGAALVGLDKTASAYNDANGNGRPDAGEVVTYTFRVTNLGSETLTQATVVDARLGQSALACPVPIQPGASSTCPSVSYSLQQADIDSGRIINSATVNAVSSTGKTATASAQATSTLPEVGTLTSSKVAGTVVDANGDGRTPTAGDTVAYTFTVTNTGNVTLNPVTVTDAKLGISLAQCGSGPLAPGNNRSCTLATYVLTQDGVDAGQVVNTATVTGTTPAGAAATSRPVNTLPLAQTPSFTWAKTAQPLIDSDGNGPDAGDSITYTFLITNTGTTSYYPVTYTDVRLGINNAACGTTPLAPGEARQCPARTYTVLQSDIDAEPAQVVNNATVFATPPNGPPEQKSSTTTTPVAGTALVEIVKTAGQIVDTDNNGVDAGDTITYTFRVTNFGTDTLTNVRYTDAKLGIDAACGTGPLAPGGSRTCPPATYTLLQSDVNAGEVVNNAAVTAATSHPGITTGDDSSITVPITPTPNYTLTKIAGALFDTNGNAVNDAGDSLTYTFRVVNTGNIDLDPIFITDAKLGIQSVRCGTGPLAPGATRDCLATVYAATQADVDAGAISNSATAAASPPQGQPLVRPASTVTPLAAAPAVTLTKTAAIPVDLDGNGRINAGDTVNYSFSVRNSGNTTLNNVLVADAKLGIVAQACGATTDPLAPGDSRLNCISKTYTLTQADIDAGQVFNRATASATPPTGADVTAPAQVTLPVAGVPQVDLQKFAGGIVDANNNGRFDAGDTILYTFTVTNTGSVTLTGVTYSDTRIGLPSTACGTAPLLPNEQRTCPARTYTLTQADVDAGTVDNTASASGLPPTGPATSDTSTTSSTINPVSGVALTKTAGSLLDANNSGRGDAGDRITYSFTVRNTGTVTLDTVLLSDAKLGLNNVACGTGPLAPGASRTCTDVVYTTLLDDFNFARIINTATATGKPPVGDPVSSSSTITTVLPYIVTATFDKTASAINDLDGNGVDAGDTITYTFVGKNTGNASTLAAVLNDPKLGIVNLYCGSGAVDPGGTITCSSATYTLTQADINAGTIDNTATVTVTSSRGLTGEIGDSTSTPLTTVPDMVVEKTAGTITDTNGNNVNDAGDTITYSFSVRNSGKVDLTQARLTDTKVGISSLTCGSGSIAPGATIPCGSAVYTLTQADIDAGVVNNTASVTAVPPSGVAITRSDTERVTPTVVKTVSFVKNASAVTDLDSNGPDLNDTISYSFTVTNTGNVTLTPVLITDAKLGVANQLCGTDPLLPGESRNCVTRTYLLTQADVDARQVVNNASLRATAPDGTVLTPTDTVTVPAVGTSSLTLDKAASAIADTDGNTKTDVGDTITYTFQVTNSGTETLSSVTLTDTKLGLNGVACGTGALLPGQTRSCTAVAYRLTQADVDNGVVNNSATVRALDPRSNPVTASDDTSTGVAEAPGLTLTKTAGTIVDGNGDGQQNVGDTITYRFTVQNTGTVTLNPVSYVDPLFSVSPVVCPGGALAPGQSRLCDTKVYALTLADLNANGRDNTATGQGTSPAGATVSSVSRTSTPINAVRSMSMDKIASNWIDTNGSGRADAGDTIHYRFVVKNTGNLTLHTVTYADARIGLVESPCIPGELNPGATAECPAIDYTLVQSDFDTAVTRPDATVGPDVKNTALASGLTPRLNRVTGSDTTDTPLPADSRLSLDKTAGTLVDNDGSGTPTIGDTITYGFVVTNVGNVTVDTISLTDAKLGINRTPCGTGSLAPGGVRTCAARTYTLTQADVDAGTVDNVARVEGTSALGTPATGNDTTSTPLEQTTNISLVKSVSAAVDNGDGIANLGDRLTYSFVVTNTGNVTIDRVTVTDAKLGINALQCGTGSLAPGASRTCAPSTYTWTAAEYAAGFASNTASATGYSGTKTATATSSVTTPVRAAVTLDKTAAPLADLDGNGPDVGDQIVYSFTVTNTGTIPLTDPRVSDAKLKITNVPCAPTALASGEVAICPDFTYTLTQADVDSGTVPNTATSFATVAGSTVRTPTASDNTVTPAAGAPSITIDKQAGAVSDANGSGRVDAGDTIRYTFLVTNTGTETLTNVTLRDTALGLNAACLATNTTPLLPGATRQCTPRVLTLTQAMIDAGTMDNTASITGTDPRGAAVTQSDGTSTPLDMLPAMTFTKTASAIRDVNNNGQQDVGDQITYTFVMTNNGNQTLTTPRYNDPLFSPDPQACGTTPLVPGATRTCATRVYSLTLADLNNNGRANSAIGTAVTPSGETLSQTSTTNTPIAAVRRIEMDKIASIVNDLDNNGPDAGDTIHYRFIVKNTGNLTLHTVTYTDTRIGLPETPCTTADLNPGESAECPAIDYTLTQADIDTMVTRGDNTVGPAVINTALASGFTPKNALVQDADSAETKIVYRSSMRLDKISGGVVDADGNGPDAGDTITYSFTVTNTGTSTLTPVTITDSKLGLLNAGCGVNLLPGEVRNCPASTYTLLQSDVDAGTVDNIATASGRNSLGVTVAANDNTSTPDSGAPAITMVKTSAGASDTNGSGRIDVGDSISYTFTVTNRGTETLTNVGVADPKVTNVVCQVRTLAPNDSTTCSGNRYLLTLADMNLGRVVNTATASGRNPRGVTVTASGTVTTLVPQSPGVSIVKAIPGFTAVNGVVTDPAAVRDTNNSGRIDAGDTVTYTFTLTNTGNVSLNPVIINDPEYGGVLPCDQSELRPGVTRVCGPIAVPVHQLDVDNGQNYNSATVAATTPDGNPNGAIDHSEIVNSFEPVSSLALDKSHAVKQDGVTTDIVDADNSGSVTPGDTLQYYFTIRNTGATTLTSLQFSDSLLGLTSVSCGPAGDTLLPGASRQCVTQPYTLTANDIQSGVITNVASATALPPPGQPIPNPAEAFDEAAVLAQPSIAIVKTGNFDDFNANGRADVGERITYAFRVTNTGNVRLTNLRLNDLLLGLNQSNCVGQTTAQLLPRQSLFCSEQTYTITEADILAGGVTNEATAFGSSGGQTVQSEPSTVVTPFTAQPSMTFLKSNSGFDDTNGNGLIDVGEVLNYTFTVTNTGNVSLNEIRISDPALGFSDVLCSAGNDAPLPPGESRTCGLSAPAQHVVSESDVIAKQFVNSAQVSALSPPGIDPPAPQDSSVTVALEPRAGVVLDKRQVGTVVDTNRDGRTNAGDQITYSFAVTNTGNVSLTTVTIDDALLGTTGAQALTCPDAVDPALPLAPGQTRTCLPQVYTLTQTDVDRGNVTNTATAVGVPVPESGLPQTESTDVVDTELAARPGFVLDKQVKVTDTNRNGKRDAGDVATYSFKVTNTGTARMTGATITDPMLGLTAYSCPAWNDVAPGESAICQPPTYKITLTDSRIGTLDNYARATAAFTGATVKMQALDNTSSVLDIPPGVTPPNVPGGVIVIIDREKGTITIGKEVFYIRKPGSLPQTGGNPGPMLAVALGTLLLGGVFVFLARRRRNDDA